MTTLNINDVSETIRITAGEMGCDCENLTADVIRAAAAEIDYGKISKLLSGSADDMDRPVGLSDVLMSLRQWGVS